MGASRIHSHLLALLHKRRKGRAQMLHDQLMIVPAQIMCRLDGHVVQHKRTDNRIDRTDAELMQILCAQLLANPQQPFYVLAIRRIPGILCLRTIVMHPSRQCLHGQHANIVGSQQIAHLCGSIKGRRDIYNYG